MLDKEQIDALEPSCMIAGKLRECDAILIAHARDSLTVIAALEAADEKVEAFQCASLLVTQSGDAADIEPHHVEAEITALRAEVERVTGLLRNESDDRKKLEADNEALRTAARQAARIVNTICSSRKGSIGAMDNVYTTQINRSFADEVQKQITALLATAPTGTTKETE